ncbi:ankyrin repeat domain-containing protein 42 [Eurytemora carolleeae]|uniref:ankyrin repeat domain-containing protein 42 n=1 Tax=Eurytemora carolleeae TaxID=1294199 RepID=UPI000C78F1F3|nr:ankyrin repeat domain-containing protein 42 [Eurytemora carolleeae]|eukprot:XP_023325614.1 ankyrin repeat domain-containing protein 42-like [Eurytemora affinis]
MEIEDTMKTPMELNQKPHGGRLILQAAKTGDIQTVRRKLKRSIFRKSLDLNLQDERECTPLHYAAKSSNLEMVRLLLENGADLRAADRHGWSVLHYAVRYGRDEMVELLLNKGADVNVKEKRGWNLLHLAARNGQAEKARILLEAGIDVQELQNQGWNALHLAVRYGQPDTISSLLEYGINIDVDNQGWTALQLAVLNGHTDIVSILLNKGADTSIVNREGRTSLDIAREEGFDRIVALLLEKEFKDGFSNLPSPPPTPPSAPELELFETNSEISIERKDREETEEMKPNSVNTFDRWKIRLKKDLEMVSNDDLSKDYIEEEEVDNEVNIGWKTFDEEKQELLQQLEKVKLKEIFRLQDEIRKMESRKEGYCEKNERQKALIESEIENLKKSIDNAEDSAKLRYQSLKEDITQLSVLLENSRVENELLQTLLNHQIRHEFCQSTLRKTELIDQLINAQKEEKDELEQSKLIKYQELEASHTFSQVETEKIKRKIRILEEELEILDMEKDRRNKSFRETIVKLRGDLEKAQRSSTAQQNEEDCNLACPVCLELLKPPLRIFQCPEGHILCENCKENPAMVHCPQCRVHLESNCSRNRALEEIARTFFT